MSLSSLWEWKKDLILGIFNHFTSKYLTHSPRFVFQPPLHCCARKAHLNKWAEGGLCSQGWCRAGLCPPKTSLGAPVLSTGPIRSVRHSFYSLVPSLGKGCKRKSRVVPDFKSMAVQLLHWEGKAHNARALLLGAHLTVLLYIFIEVPPGTEIIWSALEIL